MLADRIISTGHSFFSPLFTKIYQARTHKIASHPSRLRNQRRVNFLEKPVVYCDFSIALFVSSLGASEAHMNESVAVLTFVKLVSVITQEITLRSFFAPM